MCAVISFTTFANASSGGISGFSGKSGSTCTSCHSSGAAPSVTLTGPTSVASGSTNSYTLTVTGGTSAAGLDVATSAGTLVAGTGTKILNSELTHSAPSGPSWTFSFTAPTVTSNTTVTLWAAAIDSFGGGTGTLQKSITVTAPVANPTMTVNPTSLAFSFTTGGTIPASKTIAVSSSGAAISYTVSASTSSGGSWLSATGSGSTPGNVTVSVNPGTLAAGTYNGTVTVTSSGASNSPQSVPVTLTVTAAPPSNPSMTLSPTSLAFSFTTGGATPAAKTFSVASSGTALNYTVAATTSTGGNWLSASPNGTTPGTVSVSVNPGSLAAGTYNGSVSVSSAGASNSPQSVAVSLTVTAAPPTSSSLTLSPASLTFNFQTGGTMPAGQNVNVGSSSTTSLAYTTTGSAAWVTASPASGNTPGVLKVSVNPQGMAAGTYHSNITVNAGSASNTPQQVAVTLNISGTPTSGSGRLTTNPRYLTFSYQAGSTGTTAIPSRSTAVDTLQVGSTGSALNFTASTHGATWFTVNPSGGTTPSTLDVSVNTAGLAPGAYRGVIQLTSGSRGTYIPVFLRVTSTSGGGGGDDGGGDDGGSDDRSSSMVAQPYTYDPAKSATVAAQWVDGAGVNTSDPADPTKQGLLLAKNSTASTKAQAGVQILNVRRSLSSASISVPGPPARAPTQCSLS